MPPTSPPIPTVRQQHQARPLRSAARLVAHPAAEIGDGVALDRVTRTIPIASYDIMTYISGHGDGMAGTEGRNETMTTLTAKIDFSAPVYVGLTASDLPALVGSPKQVEWAAKIRTAAIIDLSKGLADNAHKMLTAGANDAKVTSALDGVLPRYSAKLDGLTAATWWIDNQDALTMHRAVSTIAKAK